MATDTATAESAVIPTADGAPVPIPPSIVAAYEAMIEAVPEAGQDGFASIIAAIAAATEVVDLDAPWRSQGLGDVINADVTITGIRKMPSDYPGGLPWFLVVDGYVTDTGEVVAITTGAVSVVAQLVKAHNLGAFPLRVIPRQAERPSRMGYFPQHLEVVR